MRNRRRQPFNPAKVHDRKATDLLRNAQVAPIEIDDPFEKGAKISAIRSTRNDPLAGLHSRGQIDEAQYHAGRAYQHDFETAERGPRAIDPSKEAVDGGIMPEPITESMRKAAIRLNRAERELGQHGSSLAHDVLIAGLTMAQLGQRRQMTSEAELKYLGRRFRECLDTLALVYGLAMERAGKVC